MGPWLPVLIAGFARIRSRLPELLLGPRGFGPPVRSPRHQGRRSRLAGGIEVRPSRGLPERLPNPASPDWSLSERPRHDQLERPDFPSQAKRIPVANDP